MSRRADREGAPGPADAAGGADEALISQRLDRLQTQIDELNETLRHYLERKRLHRRRRNANAELIRFGKQARKLAHFAPS